MKALKVLVPTLRVCGGLLLLLGLIIWTGKGDSLVTVHVMIGVVLIAVLGLVQEDLVTGGRHWTVQVLHVAVGMGAIWWGGHLVQLIRRQATADPSRPPVASSASQ
jgi:hypothetical protein